MKRVLFGTLLVIAAVGLAGFTAYHNSAKRNQPIVFSNNSMLAAIWHNYKVNYIEPGSGRTLDKQRNNITTSEGESYTMLRAVYQDDQATFNQSWKFTQGNLQHKDDHLFGYMYGKKADGSYGLLTDQGGDHSASDADSDTALALVLGYQRWQQSSYLEQAKPIISDIWKQEVVTVNGRPVLTADNLEKNSQGQVVVNPSYFSPYAFRLFALVDRKDNWSGLIDNSYDVTNASMSSNLDTNASAGLPPDWITMDRKSGKISPATAPNLKTDYGYDAMRVPWRLGLDYEWNKEARAKTTLERMSFLQNQWRENHQLKATYTHDGKVLGDYEAPAMYGTSMGYFTVADPTDANAVYNDKLLSLYDPNKQAWKSTLSYYDDNWAWFGMALKLHQIPNIGADFAKGAK